jgi:hypothetical protein
MFVQDYSGFTRAAEIQAQGMQNLGAAIGNVAGQVGDYFKQQGEKKKLVKQSSLQIDAALQLFPDLAPSLQSVKERMRDENIPLADRAAEAEVVANLINTGIGEMRDRSNRSFEQEKFAADQAYRQAGLGMQAAELGIRQQANQQEAQAEAAKRTEGEISILDPDTGKERKERVWKDQFGNSYDYNTKRPILDTEKYFYGEEGGLGELPPTSQVGGISDSIAKASQLNINQSPSDGAFGFTTKTRDELGKSSIGSRHVSLDFNAAASKDAKGIEIIIPNDATPEERNAANRYVQLTQKFFADRGLNRPIRGVRTAKENGRGTPGRFHTEPFFVGDGEARKIMESDPDGYAQVLANAFNGVQGVTFIAPHKKNDPGASDGKFNERDFAKGSIIPALERLSKGDLSQQTMGTPEQQAEVGRMIKQSAGMRTAQAAPSGAMPTEPRINQQPQPAPRRMVRGIPVGGGQQQETVKIVSGEEAQRFGLKPEGTYELSFNPTGGLAGVQTVSQPPTETEKAKAEETRVAKEKASASKKIAINTISEFIDDKGVATDALKSAVGYGEAFATGVAEYAPFLGTQSGKTRSDQQRLNRLIEGSILEAASLLKPVSNTDLLMLIKNRPKTTDPEETWTTYLGDIRSILADPNNYLDSGTTPTGPSSQAESDASFIQGFQSGE